MSLSRGFCGCARGLGLPARSWQATPSAATRRPMAMPLPLPGTCPLSHIERAGAWRLTVSGRCARRAWQLRRAREAHWSAPCLGSFERKRSLAMRMRRSFMSSFSFSKSNWPRSISGEEMGGRICSGSSSKYA